MATINVKDAAGTPVAIEKPLAPGQAAMAASRPVVIASDQSALTITGTVAATQSGTWNVATITNLSQLGGAAIAMGTGVRSAGTQRVTIATDDVVPASQSGTWNVGTVTTLTGIANALPVGANVIGKVSIDQTTDGTTNLVSAKQSGTWNIGTVTTVTAVTAISNALPVGANVIGKVSIDQTTDGTTNLVAAKQSGTWNVTNSAAENHIGGVHTEGALLTVTPTLDTNAYASGDTFFDTMSISNAFRVSAGRAILNSIHVIDKDDQGFGFDLVFFDTTCTFGTINVAPSIADADAANSLGVVSIPASSFIDLGGNRVATVSGVGLMLKAASASTTLYMAAIIRGAGTYTASGTIIKLGLLWD